MLARPLVLIADAQPHLALALDYLAQSAGAAKVLVTGSSYEAVAMAFEHRPSLAVFSSHLHPIEGYAVARMVRDRWNADGHAGVIWLSAGKLADCDADRALFAANRVIRHPFDPNQVADLMRSVLEQKIASER